MVRTIVLNDTNFKTIMHHIHKLKEHKYVHEPRVSDLAHIAIVPPPPVSSSTT